MNKQTKILKKKNKGGELRFPQLKTYYKAIVTNMLW